MDFEGKRSGQIPTFGDWDNANELPITQYFESARQAGLVRYTSTNLTPHQSCDPYINSNARGGRGGGYGYACNDVYGADFQKPPLRVLAVPHHHHRKSKEYCNNNRRRCACGCPPHLKEQQRIKQQVKVYDVLDMKYHHQQRTKSQQQQFPKHCAVTDKDHHHHHHHHHPTIRATHRPLNSSVAANVKPVDEDLYKIPPELLHYNSKRKRMLGFFSKCLVPCTTL